MIVPAENPVKEPAQKSRARRKRPNPQKAEPSPSAKTLSSVSLHFTIPHLRPLNNHDEPAEPEA
jgi:hypothetical protein